MDNDHSQSVILSVISPVYNGAKYLEPFLISVLQQSFPHFELIMVDDGSTDSSIEIIKSYQKKDSRIHLIGQNHKGAGSARNLGLLQAKGQYIIFLDCDDWFREDFFKTMVDRIEVDQSDIAVCGYFIYNQQTGETEKFVIPETGNQKIERTNLVFDIFAPNPWTKLYRVSFLKQINSYFKRSRHAMIGVSPIRHWLARKKYRLFGSLWFTTAPKQILRFLLNDINVQKTL